MRPIIFSTEMVKAILDGRKTQTRRVLKPQPGESAELIHDTWKNMWFANGLIADCKGSPWECPYGEAGDVLWVRESFAGDRDLEVGNDYVYKADGIKLADGYSWSSSIHMPFTAARIFLEVQSVGVERVQAITKEDVGREGVRLMVSDKDCPPGKVRPFINVLALKYMPPVSESTDDDYYRAEFAYLWDSINGKRGHGWDKNSFVWTVSFKKTEKP